MQPWAAVSARRMFGGHGLYRDGLMFALEAHGMLYLKVDEPSRPAFTAAGCRPFIYDGGGRRVEMSYWSAPPECAESAAAMARWCTLGWQAALRAQAARPKAEKSTKKTAPKAKVPPVRARRSR